MSNNVIIDLKPKIDADGNTYFIGKLNCPVLIDCSDGVTFIIFLSDKGNEQLQIAPMTKKYEKHE